MRQLWRSLLEFALAVTQQVWVLAVSVLAGLLGIVAAVRPIVIPLGALVVIAAMGLLVAMFRAFHQVRLDRDEARSERDKAVNAAVPALRAEIESEMTVSSGSIGGEPDVKVRVGHVQVVSNVEPGKCWGKILRVQQHDGKGWVNLLQFDPNPEKPLLCKWARSGGPEDSLEARESGQLDLCVSVENQQGSFFLAPAHWPPHASGHALRLPPGRYRVKLYISSERVGNADVFGEIDFDGGWEHLQLATTEPFS